MKKILKYMCGVCKDIWNDEFEADDCCTEKTIELDFYLCQECDREYEIEKEAFECCNQTKLGCILPCLNEEVEK